MGACELQFHLLVRTPVIGSIFTYYYLSNYEA